jgi:hypothetical protein
MAKSTKNTAAFHAVELGKRTLSETELYVVAGGLQDNPVSDAMNKWRADLNGAEGTLGGSIEDANTGSTLVYRKI